MRKGVKIYLVLPFLKVNVEQKLFGFTFSKGKCGAKLWLHFFEKWKKWI